MTLNTVQETGTGPTNGSTIPFTLGSAPTPGNILVAFCSYSQFSTARTISSAAGTWTKVDDVTTGNDSLATFWHVVQSGDGTGWTFTVNGSSNDFCAGVMYEVTGANTSTPINQHASATYGSVTTFPTASVTPSVVGCLPLAGLTADTAQSLVSVSSGWTSDLAENSTYHGAFGAHQNTLTTDTTTAISNTWTLGGATPGVSEILLIAPAAASVWTLSSSGSNEWATAGGGNTFSLPGGAPAAKKYEFLFVTGGANVTSVSAGGGAAWQQIGTYAHFQSSWLFYRVTTGSEGSSVVITSSASGIQQSVQFQRWSGPAYAGLDRVVGGGNNAGGGNVSPAEPTGTLSGTGELALAFAGISNDQNSPPTSLTGWSASFTDTGNGPAWFWNSGGGAGAASYSAYNTNVGTASVSPQATWTWAGQTTADLSTMVVVLTPTPRPWGNPSGGPFTLVFNDDFDTPYTTGYGTGPNPAVWADAAVNGLRIATAAQSLEWAARGWYAHSVSNSILSITAKYQNPQTIDATCPNPMAPGGNTGKYTSGWASSHPGFSFTYGYAEAKIKNTASATAAGTWPAFWMMPKGGPQIPPEIDIAEWDITNVGEVHNGYDNVAGTWQNNYYASDTSGTQWHVYGMLLDSAHVTFFLDGVQTAQFTYDGNPFAWALQFDNAVYSNTTGTGFPQTYQVEYVRVWEVTGVPAQPAITSISPASGRPTSGSVVVSFPAVSGATSYRVTACITDQWDFDGSDGSVTAVTGTGSSSPITVSGLTNGTPYNFTVAAVNATGYSVESLPVPSLAPQSGSGLLMASFP